MMQKHLTLDNKAMGEVDEYIKQNPNCTYEQVAGHIGWYFKHPEMSPWIVEYILMVMKQGGIIDPHQLLRQ